jgi:hypothetical protein
MFRRLHRIVAERDVSALKATHREICSLVARKRAPSDGGDWDTIVRIGVLVMTDSELAWLLALWGDVTSKRFESNGSCLRTSIEACYLETVAVLLPLKPLAWWGQCEITDQDDVFPLVSYAINHDLYDISACLIADTVKYSRLANVVRTIFRHITISFMSTDVSILLHRMDWLIRHCGSVLDGDVADAVYLAAYLDEALCGDWIEKHAPAIRMTYDDDNKMPLVSCLVAGGYFSLVARMPRQWRNERAQGHSFDAAFMYIGSSHIGSGLVEYMYACTDYGWDMHRSRFVYDVNDGLVLPRQLFWVVWYFMYAACHTTAQVNFRRTAQGDALIWSVTGFSLQLIGCYGTGVAHPVIGWLTHMCTNAVSIASCVIARDIGATHVYHDALCRDALPRIFDVGLYIPMPMDFCDSEQVHANLRQCRMLSQRARALAPCRYVGLRHRGWTRTVFAALVAICCADFYIPDELVYIILSLIRCNANMSYEEYVYMLACARSVVCA